MNKEFVDYKTALALKELGFDEPCWAWWHIEDCDTRFCYSEQRSPIINSRETEVVGLPTYSSAFRWFREKYDIHCEFFVDDSKTFGFLISQFVGDERVDKPIQRKYLTYEESEEVCLNKLIEMVKNTMDKEIEPLSYHYPTELRDSDGYPTQEALDYIKNWSLIWGRGDKETNTGKYFVEGMYEELIEYVRSIWTYNDAINYEDGLLEIHTFGWSGNEEIIEELKKTNLWLMKHRATQPGGHYYFKIDSDSDWDFQVTKVNFDQSVSDEETPKESDKT